MKRYENIIIGLVLIALNGYWFKMTMDLPAGSSTTIYGPRFFPQMIMLGLLICSLLFLWKGIRSQYQYMEPDDEALLRCEEGNRKKVLFFMLLIIGYVLLFVYVGFILSSIIYIILGQLIFGIRKKSILFLISPGIILALNLLFVMVFHIPVP